ncbi:MAG: hypothetical protein ACREXP_22060 [Steroidobacteraceae bacterium]
MTEVPALAHCVTALIEASAEQTFAFLADPMQVGNWALASMQARPADAPGIYRGRSLFDGAQNHFAVTPHPQLLLVEYSVGPRDALTPRIRAQVVRAESVGLAASSCYLTLTAWRPAWMPAERWGRLCASHNVEIWLIKEQVEAAARL